MTYLNEVISKSDVDAVKNLIENESYSPNYTGFFGFSDVPLTTAARFNKTDIMQYLIDKGADINGRGVWGTGPSPLEAAFRSKNIEAGALLLSQDATPKLRFIAREFDVTDHFFHEAASHQNNWAIEKILSGLRPEKATDYLILCIKNNNAWAVEKILSLCDINLNINKWDILQNNKLNHENNDFSYSYEIASNKHMQTTPLLLAAQTNAFDCVKLLVEHGAEVNSANAHGVTALHFATKKGNSDMIQFLVEQHADINMKSKGGFSVLSVAVFQGDLNTAKYLVDQGADVHGVDNNGSNTLHFSVMTGNTGMIQFLAEQHVNINTLNKDGHSPLTIAASQGNLNTMKVLLDLGAELNLKNAEGKTTLSLAIEHKALNVIHFLKESGAEVSEADQLALSKLAPLDVKHILFDEAIIVSNETAAVHSDNLNISNTTYQPASVMNNVTVTPDQNENYF